MLWLGSGNGDFDRWRPDVTSYVTPCNSSVRCCKRPLARPGGPASYNNEMLQLDISGADSCRPGVMIRESPTRAIRLGQDHIEP